MFLHIGMPKTGTTSIQRFLKTRFARLEPYGTRGLIFLLSECPLKRDVMRRIGIDEPDVEAVRKSLAALPENAVLSTEFLYQANTPDLIAQLREEIDARIILYLRHPVNHLPSLMSQRIKSGQADWAKIESSPSWDYRFEEICTMWEEYFPLIVRDYNRVDLLPDFCSICGLEPPPELPRSNRAMGARSAEQFARLNAIAKGPDRERRLIIKRLQKLIVDEPLRLSEDRAQKLRDAIPVRLERWLEAPLLEV